MLRFWSFSGVFARDLSPGRKSNRRYTGSMNMRCPDRASESRRSRALLFPAVFAALYCALKLWVLPKSERVSRIRPQNLHFAAADGGVPMVDLDVEAKRAIECHQRCGSYMLEVRRYCYDPLRTVEWGG